MLKIKNVSAKNFMSVGNNTQAVNFDNCQLTLVLGHNLDMGGDGSRNGTGKTTIINALGQCFFTPSATVFMTSALTLSRSSLDIPSFLATPAVIITKSESSISA